VLRGRKKAKKEVAYCWWQLKSMAVLLKLGDLYALLLPSRIDHVEDETPLPKAYPIPVRKTRW